MTGDGRFSVIQTEILSPLLFFFSSVIERTKKEMGFSPFIIMSRGVLILTHFTFEKRKKKKKRTFKNNFFVTIPSISGKDLGCDIFSS
jgi:hypothetical protein